MGTVNGYPGGLVVLCEPMTMVTIMRFIVTLIISLLLSAPAIACDRLDIILGGEVPDDAPVVSQIESTRDSTLVPLYPLPLTAIGINNVQAALAFTRTGHSVWRIDMLTDASGMDLRSSQSAIRPAATFLDFDENGEQVGEQFVALYPSSVAERRGNTVVIVLRGFRVSSTHSAQFVVDHYVDTKSQCMEARKITAIKTAPDEQRDELNPFAPGEVQR